MWAMRLNIVVWGYFKMQILQEILKTQNQHPVEFCAFLGSRTFVPISWMCKKQTSVSHSSTESEIISLDAGLSMDGLLALDLWDLVIEVLRTTHGIPKPTQASIRETGAALQSTPKIKQVLDQNVDRSNVDQVPSNAHLSEKESQLCTFEDNEVVIKMIIKRQKPDDETRVPHTPSYLDGKIQIKYVESKSQLADILAQGSFTRDEWHNLLHLFNIMNDTTFSCSHFSNSHPFLSAGKQSEMSKRSQESSSPGSPTAKANTMLSRLATRRTRYSQVWTLEERSTNFGCCSAQRTSTRARVSLERKMQLT